MTLKNPLIAPHASILICLGALAAEAKASDCTRTSVFRLTGFFLPFNRDLSVLDGAPSSSRPLNSRVFPEISLEGKELLSSYARIISDKPAGLLAVCGIRELPALAAFPAQPHP